MAALRVPPGYGPSPRAWGAEHDHPDHTGPRRTIPTCVGSSKAGSGASQTKADHPHVRGEQTPLDGFIQAHRGPSPRAWGAVGGAIAGQRALRTIPTCVGSRSSVSVLAVPCWDHPHVRGEQRSSTSGTMPIGGPSPRAWGAGHTVGCRPPRSTDHPHVRGEQMERGDRDRSEVGPSPRAWGAGAVSDPVTAEVRTIPTCVGSSAATSYAQTANTDHPHVRGEQESMMRRIDKFVGPSPRAWGAAARTPQHRGRRRTIPTCVGSRSCRAGRKPGPPDHPHVRGEQRPEAVANYLATGPSPRAWGAEKLTCGFSRRYLAVTTLAGSLSP